MGLRLLRSLALGAFVLVGLLSSEVAAQPVAPPATGDDAALLEAARALFRRGVDDAQRGNWRSAAESFERALAIRPAPLVRFNLAVASRNLGRYVVAVDQYRQYLRDVQPGSDAEREAAARREIALLEARRAFIRVTLTAGEPRALTLDGRALPLSLVGEEMPVDPGPHTVEVEGRLGDRQRREGALYEGEHVALPIALATEAPRAERGAVVAPTQSFGHWVARPGPDGRWVDWAQRVESTARSPWARHSFAVGLQTGVGTPTGLLALSARWFAQPWAGIELVGGAGGDLNGGFAAYAHARFTVRRAAFGLVLGPAVSVGTLTLCTDASCAQQRAPRSEVMVSLVSALSWEQLLGEHLSFRTLLGARVIGNVSSFGGPTDDLEYPQCVADRFGTGPCTFYRDRRAGGVVVMPMVSLDLSYRF
ncbi:MAG: hypothetical protein JNK72_15340 [Myxococcales bacterium]|nr:hypothetical protein [Myxococcales bacterium]